MKSRKWIVPVCVVLVFAAALAAALIPRLNRIKLVDYVRSLPDDGWFVTNYGNIYRLDPDRFAPGAIGLHPDGYAPANVNTDIRPAGEEMSLEEYTLLSGGLLRQDGTSWRIVILRTRAAVDWAKPYLLENPVQETIRAAGAKAELTGINAEYAQSIEGGRFFEGVSLTARLTLPEGVEAEGLSLRRSVYLSGRWYRMEEELAVEDPETCVFLLSPIRTAFPPDGLYRLELWLGDEPLHFQPFRFTRNGNVISADEVD